MLKRKLSRWKRVSASFSPNSSRTHLLFFQFFNLWRIAALLSRMRAYTVCPATAKARAASAPKPLEAPVITIHISLLCREDSGEASVGSQNLAVDPRAVGTCKE
jgi:hypothetical protein